MSERYPTWFVVALAASIVASRFVVNDWVAWGAVAFVFLFVAAVMGSVVNSSRTRDPIRSVVETAVADPATWPEIIRRRQAWVRNVSLSFALIIVYLGIAIYELILRGQNM